MYTIRRYVGTAQRGDPAFRQVPTVIRRVPTKRRRKLTER